MRQSTGVLFITALLGNPVPILAADTDELEEVLVTASLTGSPLSRLAGSASVLDAATLRDAGVAHFGDVLGLVPNLFFAGGTSRPRYFQLRGIGELEQYEGAPNPSIGFLIDDIDFSGIAMPAATFDLERAEVLRGPQGTAYGANALAGLISLRSQAPRGEFAISGELEAADHGTLAGGLVVNDGIGSGRTAWRLALHHFESDGFRRNAFLARDDTNGYDENLARLRVRSALTPALRMDVTAMYGDSDNGYDAWSVDNSTVTLSDRPGEDSQLSRALAVRFDYSGWEGLRLLSISTAAFADMDYSFDGDWGNEEYWGVNGPYDFYESIARDRRNLSQEFRLASVAGAGPWSWVSGVYALQLSEDYHFLDMYNGDVYRQLDSEYRALTLAAYGQVERALGSAWKISGGLRLERRDARYRDSNDLAADPVDDMFGGHVSLAWHMADGHDAWLLLTRGYKAGGINTGILLPDALRTFDPEAVWNTEAGYRALLAGGALSLQGSLFYMRRSDQQVSSSYQEDPTDPLTFLLLTDNAASGENYGFEGQLQWQASRGLLLGANLSLLQARFLDYTQAGRVLDGREQPHAPGYQLGLSAEWRSTGGWFARADWQAVDDFYFSASHDERAQGYQLTNLRVGYEARSWSVSLWARNLFDEAYAVRGFFFANEPPEWLEKRYVQNGDARQVGVRVTFAPQ